MKATLRAQLPLQPPPPEPGLPPPLVPTPVPVIDPPVPGQGDPVREPPTADPSPITTWMTALPTRVAMRRYTLFAQALALTGVGLRTLAGVARC